MQNVGQLAKRYAVMCIGRSNSKLINFKHMIWLDGVGKFHRNEVFRDSSFNNRKLSFTTSGRFLYGLLRPDRQDFRTRFDIQPNNDQCIQEISVFDLLLCQCYSVKVMSDGFIVFVLFKQNSIRQMVFNVDHVKHTAECIGYRNFTIRRPVFDSLNCGSSYCYMSYGEGKVLRFAKNPAETHLLPTAFFTRTVTRRPFSRSYIFSRDGNDDEVLCPVLTQGHLHVYDRREIIADSLGRGVVIPAGSTAFLRCSFLSQSFTVESAPLCPKTRFPIGYKGNRVSSTVLHKQLGVGMVFADVVYDVLYSLSSRTSFIFGRWFCRCIFFNIFLRKLFVSHCGFTSIVTGVLLGYISNDS
uniref:Uncharacterized protein n=1 Tax=Ditylenchus dipsaci TaxID=166011 RepID=A0A915DQ53_9BILA